MADSVEKVGISGCKKATLALVSEPGHHVAWFSGSALIVAAWLMVNLRVFADSGRTYPVAGGPCEVSFARLLKFCTAAAKVNAVCAPVFPILSGRKAGIRAYRSSRLTGVGVSWLRAFTSSARSMSSRRSIMASYTSVGTL